MINLDMPKKAKIEKKYPRVVSELRRRINSGLLSGALPGVKQLAVEFEVNFMTVDKAIRMLEDEGLVYRIPRKGSFVSRLKNIALIFNDPNPQVISSPIYTRLIMGLQGYLSTCNCAMIFENLTTNIEHRAEILSRKIDGIILLCDERFVMPQALINLPCVQAMGMIREEATWDHVTYDNARIGVIAAEYLLKRGHRRAAYVNCYPGLLNQSRFEGFQMGMLDGGGVAVKYPSALNFRTEELEEQLDQLLADSQRPTAIFSPVDDIMLVVCNFLSRRGCRPGVDFDLIGCNNEARFWQAMEVHPASIDIGVETIGIEAGKRLFHRISHPDEPRYVRRYEPKLIPGNK